jgi:hypothetical protein
MQQQRSAHLGDNENLEQAENDKRSGEMGTHPLGMARAARYTIVPLRRQKSGPFLASGKKNMNRLSDQRQNERDSFKKLIL